MKKINWVLSLLIVFLLLTTLRLKAQNRYWVSDVAANWSGNNWSTASNGAPDGGGPPSAAQTAIFDQNGTGNCTLDVSSATITTLTLSNYPAFFELNGNDLTVDGGNFTMNAAAASIADNSGGSQFVLDNLASCNFSNGTINVRLNATSQGFEFDGVTFLKSCFFDKNGNANNSGSGGNYFADTFSLDYSVGTGFLLLGTSTPDTFNAVVIVKNSSSSYIDFARNSIDNLFNGPVSLESTGSSTGITFGRVSGTSVFSASSTLSIGGGGFTSGTLSLENITYLNGTALNLTQGSSAYLYANACDFLPAITYSGGGFRSQYSRWRDDVSITKSGTSSDNANGGNTFHGNVDVVVNGTGNFTTANTVGDSFLLDLSITNNATSLVTVGDDGATYIGGNLTLVNNSSASASQSVYLSRNTDATLEIDGESFFTNSGVANDSRIYLGDQGSITFNDRVLVTNSVNASVGYIQIANNNNSTVTFNQPVELVNSGSGNNLRFYFGNNGAIVCQDSLIVRNQTTSTTGIVYIAQDDTATLNGPVVLENSQPTVTSIELGSNNSGTVYLGTGVEIITENFDYGLLFLRSVYQSTATAQNISLGANTTLEIRECDFGGNFTANAPEINTRETTYRGDLFLRRTADGSDDEHQYGGNVVLGTANLISHASGYWLWGSTEPDSFYQDLSIVDSSYASFYLSYNTDSNYIGGGLNVDRFNNHASRNFFICDNSGTALTIDGDVIIDINTDVENDDFQLGQQGLLTINGNVTITNNGDSTDIFIGNGSNAETIINGDLVYINTDFGSLKRLYIGYNGDAIITGSVTLDNATTATYSEISIASGAGSQVQIDGKITAINDGSGSDRILRFTEAGVAEYNDSIIVTNTSDASNSQVYFSRASTAVSTFNGSIEIEATGVDCDGIRFGNGNGVSTMSAGNVLVFGDLGYDANTLELSYFNQQGSDSIVLHPTTNTNFSIQYCEFGGVVDVSAPRIRTQGTVYNQEAFIEKTDTTNDYCAGGNIFMKDAEFTNSGSSHFVVTNANTDTFMMDLTMIQNGSSNLYLASSDGYSYVAGNLHVYYNGTSSNSAMVFSNDSASDVRVDGDVEIFINTASTINNFYFPNGGDILVGGNLSIDHQSSGANSIVYFCNGQYSSLDVGGKFSATQQPLCSNNGQMLIGDDGDLTIGDSLIIRNNSTSAITNNVRVAYEDSCTAVFNGPILIESPNANSEGVTFGQSGGTSTLTAGNAIEIGSNGFADGLLYLYHFTQQGAAAINLHPTGDTYFYIDDSEFGGAVDFSGPRLRTNNSTYHSSADLEKTAASDDDSGGNLFEGTTTLTNSGSANFQFGVSNPDSFMLDLIASNSGSDQLRIAVSSADNYIGGDFSLSNTASGSYSDVGMCINTGSSISVDGNATVNLAPTSTSSTSYIASRGAVDFNQNLTINQTSTNSAQLNIADISSSSVSVDGVFRLQNSGVGTVGQVYVGVNGDIVFNDSVYFLNACSATTSYIRVADDDDSEVIFNGDIVVESSVASCDGVLFGNSNGNSTLADGQKLIVGPNGFITGSLNLLNMTQVGLTSQEITTTGDSYLYIVNSSFDADVDFSAGRIRSDYSTYSGTGFFEKTGATDDRWIGGNHFTDSVSIVNSSVDYLMTSTTEPDTFLSHLSFINSGSDGMYLVDDVAGNYIAGNLWIENIGSGSSAFINSCYGVGSSLAIDGNVSVVNNGTASSNNMSIARYGAIDIGGNLTFSANPTGNADVIFAEASVSSITVGGVTRIENDGSSTTNRVFFASNGAVTLNDSLYLINTADATNSQIYAAHNSAASLTVNGHIVVESSTANCDGVYFGSSQGSTTLNDPFTINISSNGFIDGRLFLRNFSQLGNTAQSITLSSNAISEWINADWSGNVSLVAPRLWFSDCDFDGDFSVEKNGATDDQSSGNNKIAGNLTMLNSGSGYLRMAASSPDSVEGNVALTITGTDHIILGGGSANNFIGGDISMMHSATSGTSYFILADNSPTTFSIDGNVSYTNNSSGGDQRLYIGNSGDITLNGTVDIDVTSSSNNSYVYLGNASNSEVVFNGAVNIDHYPTGSSTHQMYIGNQGDVVFNADLSISSNTAANNNQIYIGNNAASLVTFNGNFEIEQFNAASDGVYFGQNNSNSVLTDGHRITIGTNGFIGSNLSVRNLTSQTTLAQSWTLSGTTIFTSQANTFAGDLTVNSPRLLANSSTYNGDVVFHKTGATNDNSGGGNTYNGNVSFINSGTGYLMQASSTADDYNGNVHYENSAGGNLFPAYNVACTYAGDVTLNIGQNTILASNNGRMTFDGAGPQVISDLGSTATIQFQRITIDKSADTLELQTPVLIGSNATFTSGVVKTDNTNVLHFSDNSTATVNANKLSFVQGPVLKTGNDAFTFPVGEEIYRPIAISAPSNTSHQFRAEYLHENTADSYQWGSWLDPIKRVSSREYWLLDRITGTSNVTVTLSWDTNSGGVDTLSNLRVAHWNGSKWESLGNGGTTGDEISGTIVTTSAVTSFSPFTLGTTSTTSNPLPIELISFSAQNREVDVQLNWVTATEINNDFFELERSQDGISFETIGKVAGAGNSNFELEYSYLDEKPLDGISYYRLKQVDFDGKFSYSNIEPINRSTASDIKAWAYDRTLYLTSDDTRLDKFELYSSTGALVESRELANEDLSYFQLQLSAKLAAGIYIAVFSSEYKQTTQKIILQ